MVKGAALNIVIVIALVIGLICSTIIAAAFYYKIDYLKKNRYDALRNDLLSGINILLHSPDSTYRNGRALALFPLAEDSVFLTRIDWGAYAVGIVTTWRQQDTLYSTFSIGKTVDSNKWYALYMADQQTPVSISGYTNIRGDAFLPFGTITTSYVDNKFYTGDKGLVIGQKRESNKDLPLLSISRLQYIDDLKKLKASTGANLNSDSLFISFRKPTCVIALSKEPLTLQHKHWSGNLVLISDTTITIDSTNVLKNTIIMAKSIIVHNGFKGQCQLFASDSLSVGKRCILSYPSCLGVIRLQPDRSTVAAYLSFSDLSSISGLLFVLDSTTDNPHSIITLGKGARISGEVYSQNIISMQDSVVIDGSLTTKTTLYKGNSGLFAEYLINCRIDSKSLSPYYLSSDLMPASGTKQKILQWLESN